MRATVTVLAKGAENPFVQVPALGGGGVTGSNSLWRRFRDLLANIASGTGIYSRGAAAARPKLWYSTSNAVVPVTLAAVQAADTLTLNGQALTATQQRSTGTLTAVSAIATNTAVVNGHTFTGVDGAAGANQFSVDTGDTQTATSLALAIETAAAIPTNTLLYGIVGAKSATNVVTVFAQSPGAGGDAITLVGTATTLEASAAVLANGAAAAANQFDYVGTDKVNAGSLADALAASTTALVSGQLVGTNRAGVVTCSNVTAGDYVMLAGVKLTAIATATDTGGARIGTFPPDVWAMNSTDTNDAISLVNCINAHPRLRELFLASNSSGVVTVRERSPSIGGEAILSSSNGTRLGVTGTVNGLLQPTATCLVQAIHGGTPGNGFTVASSSAGRIAINSQTRLTGGTSVAVTY